MSTLSEKSAGDVDPMEVLPLNIGFAVTCLDGSMQYEQREIQGWWKTVRDHILSPPHAQQGKGEAKSHDDADRIISHDEAEEAAQRLINSHFRKEPCARVGIPARPGYDDDLVISQYIRQQRALSPPASTAAPRAGEIEEAAQRIHEAQWGEGTWNEAAFDAKGMARVRAQAALHAPAPGEGLRSLYDYTDAEIGNEHHRRMMTKLGDQRVGVHLPTESFALAATNPEKA